MAAVHHVEIWVPDVGRARRSWGWLFGALGWSDFQDWPGGHSWRAADGSYVVIEQSPDLTGAVHVRTAPGMNHLSITASDAATVDLIAAEAAEHGWQQLYADAFPHAGGPQHYAAFLVDADGYELEIVALDTAQPV